MTHFLVCEKMYLPGGQSSNKPFGMADVGEVCFVCAKPSLPYS